jgi:hypothetical protein
MQIWDGILDEEMKVMLELVASDGVGDWERKREILKSRLGPHVSSIHELASKWEIAAPLVKAKLMEKPEMPCGHSCATCPTRATCHLEEMLDMEDFGIQKTKRPEDVRPDEVPVQKTAVIA